MPSRAPLISPTTHKSEHSSDETVAALAAASDAATGKSAGSGSPLPPAEPTARMRKIAAILNHFDVGRVRGIRPITRGSKQAPKFKVYTDRGKFMLKQRAHEPQQDVRVMFGHKIQGMLAERGFPLPRLIRTRTDDTSVLRIKGHTYELFEFIKGDSYDESLLATHGSGQTLAKFHDLLTECELSDAENKALKHSYHQSRGILRCLGLIPRALTRTASSYNEQIGQLSDFVMQAYQHAAERVDEMGVKHWPSCVIHHDWHPGNVLFRGQRVAAVVDYDRARIQPRIIDVANGALHFSILGGKGAKPTDWPEYLDGSRFKRFVRGYEECTGQALTPSEAYAVPWLMIEAMIAESAIPIAATGTFSRVDGVIFLQMVKRKADWLTENAERLIDMIEH